MIDINELRRLALDGDLAAMQEIILRLEAAEKERELDEQRIADLMADLNRVGHENEELRSLVVMRFDHERPPQFIQGYDQHDLLEPVTAEQCRWFVAEIERLRAKIAAMEKQGPVAWADAFGEPFRNRCEIDGVASPLYALPGAKGEDK